MSYYSNYIISLILLYVLLYLAGASIQSFLNVVVYRTQRGESFVKGRSNCDYCDAPISFIYLIPTIGYLISKGRCVRCGHKVSKTHLITEGLWGLLLMLLTYMYGFNPQVILMFLYLSLCQVLLRLLHTSKGVG